MKLISMTDFVLEQKQSESIIEKQFINAELITLEKIRNYANFLKQPLTLGLFVPCDGDLFLDAPYYADGIDKIEEYKKLREKVLFKEKLHFDLGVIRHHISQGRNIEYLANFGSLELTESALKQIGL